MIDTDSSLKDQQSKHSPGSSRRRHRGSIRQRGAGSFEVRVFVGVNSETGQRDYVSRTIRGSRRDAEVELTKVLRQIDEGAVAPRSGSIGELVEAWYRLRSPNLSPPVAHNYRRIIDRNILPRWGAVSLRQLRVKDLDTWYARLLSSGGVNGGPLSANSVRRVHAVLHAALAQGVRWGQLVANPADAVTPPSVHRQSIVLTAGSDDFALLISSAKRVNQVLPVYFRLALATGARRGELCALRWRDVDLAKGVIQIGRSLVEAAGVVTEKDTKTHQVRRVSVDTTTKELLSEYHSKVLTLCVDAGGHLPDNSFVFSHDPEGRTPWRPGYVTAAFCRLRNELGMRSLRLHDLRHASASFLLAGGVDVKTVSVRLGHAQTSTTLDIYAHMINQADDRAASTLGAFLDEKG